MMGRPMWLVTTGQETRSKPSGAAPPTPLTQQSTHTELTVASPANKRRAYGEGRFPYKEPNRLTFGVPDPYPDVLSDDKIL